MIKFETLKAAGTKTALDKVYEADETSADSTDHADDRSLRETFQPLSDWYSSHTFRSMLNIGRIPLND